MQKVDINTLVNENNILNKNIPNNIIIVGTIDELIIEYEYEKLELSRVKCKEIYYYNQEGESIKNHILPNSLKNLYCDKNKLLSIPNLPYSLEILNCDNNQFVSLPDLPNSLRILHCDKNKLLSLPNLPYSLEILNCDNNHLTSLPNLPNYLEYLYCSDNQLTSLPDFSHINHKLELSFIQDLPIKCIPYNTNIYLYNGYNSSRKYNKIIIKGYPHNPITDQKELDQYMDYVKNYKLNRIKSARK